MDANKLRNGHKMLLNDEPYLVLTYTLRAVSRGSGKMIGKLKNLISGTTLEKTYMSTDKVDEADITESNAQYLYSDNGNFVFMDNESFEQFEFSAEKLGDLCDFLKDDMEVMIMRFNGNPINVELPPTIELEVTETTPGVKGDTATGGTKPATLETGVVVSVPLFINEGDKVVVNTMTKEYKERVK